MGKRLLLISGNYYPEPTGIGKYNSEMISWLADHGFICTVISTYPYYPHWKLYDNYTKKGKWFSKEKITTANGKEITVYRCPHYVPEKPSGKKRMLLDISFLATLTAKLVSFAGKKFDYIINVTPPLSLGIVAATYKRISGAKFLYHIQDLQVDVATDLNMINSKRAINLLFKIERYVLRQADKISTISKVMAEKVSYKTTKPVHVFPNWTNTEVFFPLDDKNAIKSAYGFKPDMPLILYSGSIGEKQGLEIMIDIAQNFLINNIHAQFVISGSGPYKKNLEQNAQQKNLTNIRFMPLQPHEELNRFLNMADVHLIIQKANVADHVMPSKLATIFAVGGLAIITANKGSGLYQMVTENSIALLCSAEDINTLSATIQSSFYTDTSEIRQNAYLYAKQFLSIHTIMQKFQKEIMEADV